jgi:hypothetical protein
MAAYVQDEFNIGKKIKINAGLRYSLFAQVGPFKHYTYDANNNKTDSTNYASGEVVKTYGGLEPRLNVRYELTEASSVKASVTKTYQYIHLVSNNGSTLPTDIWVPSTGTVQPQESWQYSTGYFHNFLNNKLETSVEVYYKDMKHQIEYKEGYTPNNITEPELNYVFGKGESYGAEFYINKTKGKFTGWIAYTLSWTWKTFKDLNHGETFPAKYDRRHDLSVVASFEMNSRWTLSAIFIYGSGNAITLPTNFYFINGQLTQQYSNINAYRLPAYHRLDLSAVYTPKPKTGRKWQGSWVFSVYNVYNHWNPYFLYVDTEGSVSQGINLSVKQVTIFPIIPSVTYNFKF